jgi:hypothetical protein
MTIYYPFLLKKGSVWSPEETPEIDALQEGYLATLRRLATLGKLVIDGPLLDSSVTRGKIRRVGVLKTPSLDE